VDISDNGALHRFVAQLRTLHSECDKPPYRRLVTISGKLGKLYEDPHSGPRGLPTLSASAISEVLACRRKNLPSWPWVASFVLSNQRAAYEAHVRADDPGPSTLPRWLELLRAARVEAGEEPPEGGPGPASAPPEPHADRPGPPGDRAPDANPGPPGPRWRTTLPPATGTGQPPDTDLPQGRVWAAEAVPPGTEPEVTYQVAALMEGDPPRASRAPAPGTEPSRTPRPPVAGPLRPPGGAVVPNSALPLPVGAWHPLPWAPTLAAPSRPFGSGPNRSLAIASVLRSEIRPHTA
jgi:hypothetical protein